MEVGAIKQAFNNEIIHLKKYLNQAKIQLIRKLTRKAKTFKQPKKIPDHLKEKLNRKAESAVAEVLLLKKVKSKDMAQFAITHKGELSTFLNKPKVDNEKAYARLWLHKALQSKYIMLRQHFGNLAIDDLLMSREERRKMKKEAIEKKKKKGKIKDIKLSLSTQDDWNVEEVNTKLHTDIVKRIDTSKNLKFEQNDEIYEDNEKRTIFDATNNSDDARAVPTNIVENDDELAETEDEDNMVCNAINEPLDNSTVVDCEVNNLIDTNKKQFKDLRKKPQQKLQANKKKFSKKVPNKKQENITPEPVIETKVVDPFFITPSGDNYMSLVEARPPDEVKDEHKQGNRNYRRAVMFGRTPKFKSKQFSNRFQNNEDFKLDFKNRIEHKNNRIDNKIDFKAKEEKLHPSWEAKKRMSAVLPFQGKKIVFD